MVRKWKTHLLWLQSKRSVDFPSAKINVTAWEQNAVPLLWKLHFFSSAAFQNASQLFRQIPENSGLEIIWLTEMRMGLASREISGQQMPPSQCVLGSSPSPCASSSLGTFPTSLTSLPRDQHEFIGYVIFNDFSLPRCFHGISICMGMQKARLAKKYG